MSKEKQIEEMANEICINCNSRMHCHDGLKNACLCRKVANILYTAGYRKQNNVGEWVKVYQNNVATVYECSRCNHLTTSISEYCICGAKMKGV